MAHRLAYFVLPLLCFLSCRCWAAEPVRTLAIVDAGVQQSEDAPFVTTDYQFLPGEYVYVTFHVTGYAVKLNDEKELRALDLAFTVAPQDAGGTPLTEPMGGAIQTQLGTEDKNWTPSKQFSFLIPSFVPNANYRIRITVKDLLAGTEAAKDLAFHIRGPRIAPLEGINVQNFRFLRQEGAGEALEVAAYAPGDTVYSEFDLAGFTTGNGNEYKVAYGITVLRPDGKTFLDQPEAARLGDRTFYPARYLPCILQILTEKTSPRGEYTILLTAHDVLSDKTAVTRRTFTLE